MTPTLDTGAANLTHGARDPTSVRVDAYNVELTDPSGEGFLGSGPISGIHTTPGS